MKIYTLISIIMKSALNVSTMIYAPFFQFKLLRVKLVWDLGEPLSTYAPFFQNKLLRVKACFGALADRCRLTRRFTYSCFSRVNAWLRPWRTNVDLRAIYLFKLFARKSLSGTLADQCRLTRHFSNSSFLRVKLVLVYGIKCIWDHAEV